MTVIIRYVILNLNKGPRVAAEQCQEADEAIEEAVEAPEDEELKAALALEASAMSSSYETFSCMIQYHRIGYIPSSDILV